MHVTTWETDLFAHRSHFVLCKKKKKVQVVTVTREAVSSIAAYGNAIRIPFPAQERAL
jgi:hypothetical protein